MLPGQGVIFTAINMLALLTSVRQAAISNRSCSYTVVQTLTAGVTYISVSRNTGLSRIQHHQTPHDRGKTFLWKTHRMYRAPWCYIYLLTPYSRVLLEKLTGFAANQEIPRILWNPKVHYRTHKCPPPVPILNQLHPVPTSWRSILILFSHLCLGLPNGLFPSGFPPFLHTCHMPRPSHSSRFYHPYNI